MDFDFEIHSGKRKRSSSCSSISSNEKLAAKTLLELNDDCLYHIFSFLNLHEVFVVDHIKNSRIHKIAALYYTHKASHFQRKKFFNYGDFTPYTEDYVFDTIGPYLIHAELDLDTEYKANNLLMSADRVLLPLLSEKCSNLRSLKLDRLDIVEKRIHRCEDLYRRLDKLILYKCTLYESPNTFGSILSKLSYLSISYCNYVYGHFLVHMENLTTLQLKSCARVKNENLNKFLTSENASKLKQLQLINCSNAMSNTLCYSFLKNLESLSLEINQVMFTESTIDALVQLTKLTKLNLSCCTENALNIDSMLSKISGKCQLEELQLRNFKFGLETVQVIGSFKQLKMFVGDFLQKDHIGNVLYLKVSRVLPHNLKYLSLKDGTIADNEFVILGVIKSLPKLERLDLYKTHHKNCLNIFQKIVNILKVDTSRLPLKLTFHKKYVDNDNDGPEDPEHVAFFMANKSFLTVDVEFNDLIIADDDESDGYYDSDSVSSGPSINNRSYWNDFNNSESPSDSDEEKSNSDYSVDASVGWFDMFW